MQCCGGHSSVLCGDIITTLGIPSVLNRMFGTIQGYHLSLWRIFSTIEGYHQYCGGISSVLWRDTVRFGGAFRWDGVTISRLTGAFDTMQGYHLSL